MHKRQTIRNGTTSLLTGLTTTGSNVFPSRVHELSDDELPALKVYTGEEEVLEDSVSKSYSGIIELQLRIECVVKVNDTFDDKLDAILEEVQAAISADRLDGDAINMHYQGLESVEFGEGELDIGMQTILYTVHYEQTI